MEFLDAKCMELVEKHLGYTRPIQPANFYTLVETSGSHDQHDKEVSSIACITLSHYLMPASHGRN